MNFEADVIERSSEIPVIVDFWAPWCGPCQALGPIIEQLAVEASGVWELIKINTDDHPELMERFKIRGIPAVKMFDKGEVIAEFGGALPKFQIEKWLDEHLPSEQKQTFAAIVEQLESNPSDLDALESFVDANPDFVDAKIMLAKSLIFSNKDAAAELIDQVRPGHRDYHQVEPLGHLLELMELELRDEHPTQAKLVSVKGHLRNAEFDQALETLISTVMVDKSYLKELPRRATVALFQWLGPSHELTKKYRRRFDMALY